MALSDIWDRWEWSTSSASTYTPFTRINTTCPAAKNDDDNEPEITLDQLNYFCKLAKKDKKLAEIGRIVLVDVNIKLPF